MHLAPEKSDEVKAWVVRKLEDISDADSDVLADYVLALLTSDEPDESIRKSCVENLEDFLKDHTKAFVDEIFARFGPASARPAPVLPAKPSVWPSAQALQDVSPFVTGGNPFVHNGKFGNDIGSSSAGRKRGFAEQNGSLQDQYYPTQGRPAKAVKSRRKGAKAQRQNGQRLFDPFSIPHLSNMEISGQGTTPTFPMFDPTDPLSTMAFQTMMQAFGMVGTRQRCHDYDTKGFCARGGSCPFQHGEVTVEYDPTNAIVGSTTQVDKRKSRRRDIPRSKRADFSDPSPNFDKSITTIVVEQIPEENFEESRVREFFTQYGKVVDVTLKAYKHLALVKYESYEAARRAYDSPKVIFDNRFVKVYWYRPTKDGRRSNPPKSLDESGRTDADDMSIDPEVFARQQEAAQKAYEERRAKLEANADARRNLRAQQQELLARHEAERKELLARITKAEARKVGSSGNTSADQKDIAAATTAMDAKAAEKDKVQKALREQLALLEAEAKFLGIDPDAPPTPQQYMTSQYHPGGRGGYRGRGSYRGRGRGAAFGSRSHSTGAVLRLDNRPKRIAISLPEGTVFDRVKDEALRQHLLSISEFVSIDQDPDKPQAQGVIITYAERYQAEILIDRGRDVPGIGEVEMKWIPGSSPVQHSGQGSAVTGGHRGNEDEVMSDADSEVQFEITHDHDNSHAYQSAEVDYDVASEDEYDRIT